MGNQYRIQDDAWRGIECRIKRWYWPFWKCIEGNTFHPDDIEGAKAFIAAHKARKWFWYRN